MLNMRYVVSYQDGTTKAGQTRPKDEVALERKFDIGIAELLERSEGGAWSIGRLRVEYLYYLAWSNLNGSGQEVRDFDAFLAVIDDVDFDEDEVAAETDPTRSGASPD